MTMREKIACGGGQCTTALAPHHHNFFCCCLLLLTAISASMASAVSVSAASTLGMQRRPNFVFILTDDQDTRLGLDDAYTDLGSVDAMPMVKEKLMQQGIRGSHAMVNTPICCPSRTETFTGRYFHNIGPPNDPGDCMFANTTHVVLENGLFASFKNAGYNVGVFGKVTNDQGNILDRMIRARAATYIDSPLDYNDYNGLRYQRLLTNGSAYVETIAATDPVFGTPYQTTQIGNRTLRYLDAFLGARVRPSVEESSDQATADTTTTTTTTTAELAPFFLYIGPHAPHYPAAPAPWYEHLWDNASAPLTANYNVSDAGKPQHIRQNPYLTQEAGCWQDQHFRDRWASLKSVDEVFDAVHARLAQAGELNNTYFVYTSDHGYKLGQWMVPTSKQHPYETDVNVPFFVAGPGIPANATMAQLFGNVDVLPTLLDLAGLPIPPSVDGKSFKRFLLDPKESMGSWRTELLIEYKSVGTYFNNHSQIWAPSDPFCGSSSGPPAGLKPNLTCVEQDGLHAGSCYFIDSLHSNNWRELRILDSDTGKNMAYVEYDPLWKWESNTTLQWYELYDLTKDPYQLNNIYNQSSSAEKASLHERLARYYSCAGTSCP